MTHLLCVYLYILKTNENVKNSRRVEVLLVSHIERVNVLLSNCHRCIRWGYFINGSFYGKNGVICNKDFKNVKRNEANVILIGFLWGKTSKSQFFISLLIFFKISFVVIYKIIMRIDNRKKEKIFNKDIIQQKSGCLKRQK